MIGSTLRDGVILLGFALVFVLLFRRLGLGATLGFLVAGAMVGPQVLGLVGDAEQKMGIAELGITLLLFLVGLELNPSRLWRMKQDIFALGALQVALCGAAIAAIVWIIAGFSPAAALAVGLPLALSSTAQVLPMLQSAGRLKTPFGERAFSILLFQDLSIVPMITIVAALSRAPAPADAPPGWLLAVYTVLAIVGLVASGRFLLRPMFRLIGVLGEREMFVFAALFTVIASSAVMEALGLSTALGAFIAGVMLADSPYRHELEADVDPFRAILLGLFFLSVGMMLDLNAIAERPIFVIGMAILLIVTKTAIMKFGFVLFAQAKDALLIEPEAASLFGAVVTLSMATTPFLMMFTRRFRAEPTTSTEGLDEPQSDGASALVIGYGRFGQTVAQLLISQGITVSLIDRDPEMIETAGSFGAKVYYGDGTRLDLLRQAGAESVQLLLFCIDEDQVDAPLLHAVKESFPSASVFVRVYDRRSLVKLKDAPMAGSVRETLESAVAMARQALSDVGVDSEEIGRTEAAYRQKDLDRLKAQAVAGDMHAGDSHLIRGRLNPVEEAG
ncbi:MAG: sodium:proton exchanger [Sphingomonas sp. 12-62-6]|nr:MAG: sodium:proton exchanger [Sphingomonas sp. 12-62-6]